MPHFALIFFPPLFHSRGVFFCCCCFSVTRSCEISIITVVCFLLSIFIFIFSPLNWNDWGSGVKEVNCAVGTLSKKKKSAPAFTSITSLIKILKANNTYEERIFFFTFSSLVSSYCERLGRISSYLQN